jgi:hypothetical protein
LATQKKITLSHDDLVKIIEKQSRDARELVLKEKRRKLRKNPKKFQKEQKKPLNVLQKIYETEKQIARDRRKKGVTMLSIIKETLELTKEFATLKSPIEVYIFVGGVWLTGLAIGLNLG